MRRPTLVAISAAFWMVAMAAPAVFRSPWLVVGIPAVALVANAWILWRLLRSAPAASASDLTPPGKAKRIALGDERG